MDYGKKLYSSNSLGLVKIIAVLISISLFAKLWFQTHSDLIFLNNIDKFESSVLSFHFAYPQEFFLYLLLILFPSIYYGFIRGVVFYRDGVILNRGLPFFNTFIAFDQIKNYQVVDSRRMISIRLIDSGDDFLFVINDIDRGVAILDQNGVQGDLGTQINSDVRARKKLAIWFVVVGFVTCFIQFSTSIKLLFN